MIETESSLNGWLATEKPDDAIEYYQDGHGVIHQLPPFRPPDNATYYVDYYNKLSVKSRAMAHARLGYVLTTTDIIRSAEKRVLDVGFGNGDFLRACADAGLTPFGYDKYATDLGDARIRTSTAPCVLNEPYDVITFFDALEHFPEIGFVKDLRTRFLTISVPWLHFTIDSAEFLRWKHRKPHEHLHHFTEESLRAFMLASGYTYVHHCNVEDAIRCIGDGGGMPNVLTATFKKRCS